MSLDLQALLRRAESLPLAYRQQAMQALAAKYGDQLSKLHARRDPAERAYYASRPADYFEDILGLTVRWYVDGRAYDQLLRVIDTLVTEPFLIVAGGNGLGKTLALAGVASWHHDAVGAQNNDAGSRTLLLGPTETQVFQSVYSKVVTLATQAEARGYGMPPHRSERTPSWMPRPEWAMEAITPGATSGDALSHRASGRHGDNLYALIEEAQGVRSAIVESIKGSTSGGGPGILPGGEGWQRNGVLAILNPDRRDAAVAQLARGSTWRLISLSALDHPNVRTRRRIVPGGAVSVRFVDSSVKDDCQRIGAYPSEAVPDPERDDFVYALPEKLGEEGGGPRPDGFPGHVDAPLAVYRPQPLFSTRILGTWPKQGENDLFNAAAWDAAVERWKRRQDPQEPPDGIGVDSAYSEREEADDAVAAPRWGPDGVELLSRWSEMRASGDAAGIEGLTGSIRIGRLVTAPKGDGSVVAGAFWRIWPHQSSAWAVDDGGGQGIIDHARHTLRVPVSPVAFGAAAPAPEPGMLWAGDTMRDWLYCLAASVINRGWVDLPDDPLLREEAMATWAVPKGQRNYEVRERKPNGIIETVKRPVSTRGLPPKDEIKRLLSPQRSPDRLDALVLSLLRQKAPSREGSALPLYAVSSHFIR